MKSFIIILILLLVAGGAFLLSRQDDADAPINGENTSTEGDNMMQHTGNYNIIPISHATMVLEWGGEVIYIDPIGGEEAFAGQKEPTIIAVTDIHGDHLSADTLSAVVVESTTILAPQAVFDELNADLQGVTQVMANGEKIEINGFSVEALPGYNLPEQGIEIRHEKGRGNGYVFEREGERVYVAGDTAGIPEMRALTDINTAFIPMNLPFTMSVEDAADAVLTFSPDRVYPYHYRTPEGYSDILKFKELVNAGNPDIQVIILRWYEDEADPAATMEVNGDAMSNSDNSGDSMSNNMENNSDVVIDVTGKNFEFSVKEIKVKEGDIVTINFVSSSGFHDWVVDQFDASTDQVNSGESSSVTFVADKAGEYEYYCSVGNHRQLGMVGKLIVE